MSELVPLIKFAVGYGVAALVLEPLGMVEKHPRRILEQLHRG